MRVAIVGAGIAGNAAARLLSEHCDVTVFESERRIGGHSATVDIDYDGVPIAVDTGFIVYNTLNYPNLTAMFDYLGVETQASDMSFSVSIGNGDFEWVGRTHDVMNGLFAQRRNLVNPRYLGMLLEILRFQKSARNDLAAGRLAGLSLGDYIQHERFSAYFRDRYIVPMGAAIWSTPAERMLDFPAENFVAFFENHKLLHWERPVWRTVTGGSRSMSRSSRRRSATAIASAARSWRSPATPSGSASPRPMGLPTASTMSSWRPIPTRRWRCWRTRPRRSAPSSPPSVTGRTRSISTATRG